MGYGRAMEPLPMAQAPRIDTIFFDFGGVIADEGFMHGLKTMAREQGLDPEAAFAEAVEVMYGCGYLVGTAPEDAFWDGLAERAGLAGDREAMRARILDGFVIRPRVLELATLLAADGKRVAILSDQTDWLDLLEARHGFFHYFDEVFNSYHAGHSKREAAFFHLALETMGTEAPRALFIDDSSRHVPFAQELGLHAIHFETLPQVERDMGALLPELKPMLFTSEAAWTKAPHGGA